MRSKSEETAKLCLVRDSPPRSAPSMIPRRTKVKKQVRVSSEPAIIMKSKIIPRDDDSQSDLLTNPSEGCFELLSDLEISCSKNISWDGSKMYVNQQRTIGTNYSTNDFSKKILLHIKLQTINQGIKFYCQVQHQTQRVHCRSASESAVTGTSSSAVDENFFNINFRAFQGTTFHGLKLPTSGSTNCKISR